MGGGIMDAVEKRPKNMYTTKRSHLEAKIRHLIQWVGVKNSSSDTSTHTAAVFLLAIVCRYISIHKTDYDLQQYIIQILT